MADCYFSQFAYGDIHRLTKRGIGASRFARCMHSPYGGEAHEVEFGVATLWVGGAFTE